MLLPPPPGWGGEGGVSATWTQRIPEAERLMNQGKIKEAKALLEAPSAPEPLEVVDVICEEKGLASPCVSIDSLRATIFPTVPQSTLKSMLDDFGCARFKE